MKKLRFSVAEHAGFDDIKAFYERLLEPIERERYINIDIETISWEQLWQYVQQKSQALPDLDLSEVGSTWLGSLADTNAIQVLPAEVSSRLGTSTIPETAWMSIRRISKTSVLFVPWLLDIRVIYYWKDHLRAAGVDEDRAFKSIDTMGETMEKLAAIGQAGWGAPTFSCINTVYNLSSWIWSLGQDYLSPDGKSTALCDPTVLEAMTAYFALGRYMPGPFDSYEAVSRAFKKKQITAFMCGPWSWRYFSENRDEILDLNNIGVALPMGCPFIGGSSLVVWKQADKAAIDHAVALIQYLMGDYAQRELHRIKGLLPVNRNVLRMAPFSTDPNYKTMINGLPKGRFLSNSPLWSHIESSLVRVFGLVWGMLRQNDFRMKTDLLERHLAPLSARFDRMLDMF